MKKVSIEYCHIYPGGDNKKEIEEANIWMPRIIGMFKDCHIQKCIMFDDIHATRVIDEKFINSIIDQLKVKPDCIYLESEFIQEANEMVKKINPKERDFIRSDERVWLRENVEKFRTSTEFLLNWKNKDGKTEFSCPSLAATSYLTRLGLIKSDGVKTIYGDNLMIADHLLNVLSSYYVQVEDKAQSIVEATFKEALRKISWFFY
ncbi:MAG: hypothetical protein Q7T79_00345 [bacterium]|nr:hypothetical protein [bacterium]